MNGLCRVQFRKSQLEKEQEQAANAKAKAKIKIITEVDAKSTRDNVPINTVNSMVLKYYFRKILMANQS